MGHRLSLPPQSIEKEAARKEGEFQQDPGKTAISERKAAPRREHRNLATNRPDDLLVMRNGESSESQQGAGGTFHHHSLATEDKGLPLRSRLLLP
jgi:hypothetical protein